MSLFKSSHNTSFNKKKQKHLTYEVWRSSGRSLSFPSGWCHHHKSAQTPVICWQRERICFASSHSTVPTYSEPQQRPAPHPSLWPLATDTKISTQSRLMIHLRKRNSLKKCLKEASDMLTCFHMCTCPIFMVFPAITISDKILETWSYW